MKKSILLICFSILAIACNSNTEEIDNPNMAPATPRLSSPEDNLFCTENKLDFSWLPSIDPEGDNISYTFEISTDSDFLTDVNKTELSSLSLNKEVAKGKDFYWRVKAIDNQGNNSNYSAIRRFYSEGAQTSNSLPTVPKLIKPLENVISGLDANLAWEATDADNEELHFNLFFGRTKFPPLLQENLSANSYVVNNLVAGKTYYWKIIVKDESGGKTIGEVWSFKTE